MKSHFGFLSFCLLAALFLSSPLCAAFKIDVHINDAKNPTLTFGEADDLTRSPHPPFSGMFGVVDVCFAGMKDEWYNNLAEDIKKWYENLAEDIKTQDDANQWILVAKSNARLTFNFQDPNETPALYIVYKDVKDPNKPVEPVLVEDENSFSVKAGGVYTITRDAGAAPAPDPNADSNQFIAKGEAGTITITPDFTPKTMNISFSSGIGVLAYDGEDLEARGLTLADVDWIIKVVYDGDVAYKWTAPYTELQVTLGDDGTRGGAIVTMTAIRSSAPSIQTTITTLGEEDTQKITSIIDWILQKFGTLDFDQNGVIDINDVMYLYNFFANGSPEFSDDPDEENDNIAGLLDFTAKSPDNPDDMADAKTAIDIFRNDADSLKFDGNAGDLNINDVMYFYNFFANGFPEFSDDPDEENDNIAGLLDFTAKSPDNPDDMAAAQAAMETLRDYKSNL
jgi:hypothetical protein